MEEQPHSKSTDELLAGLNDPDPGQRIETLNSFVRSKNIDQQVLDELALTAKGDPDQQVRQAAKNALRSLGVDFKRLQKGSIPSNRRIAWSSPDFWMGVGLFFGLNILLWSCLNLSNIGFFQSSSTLANALPFLLNFGLFIYFSLTRPQIAWGMLVGCGGVFMLVLFVGVLFWVTCFGLPVLYNR